MTYSPSRRMALKRGGVAALTFATLITMSSGIAFSNDKLETDTMATSDMIDGPQGKLATYVGGAGTDVSVVFLHGDSGRASQWDEVAALVAAQHHAISFDFRGHGASAPADDGDYGFAGRAGDLDAVVSAQGSEAIVLVAHSGAAGVALDYAGAHMDQVKGILLIDPATDPRGIPEEMRAGFLAAFSGPGGVEAIKGYYASIAGTNPATIARVQSDAEAVHPDARLGVAEALLAWDPEAAINGYSGPIEMILTSPNDTPEALYHLSSAIKHSVLAETGHWVQIDAADKIAAAVLRFTEAL